MNSHFESFTTVLVVLGGMMLCRGSKFSLYHYILHVFETFQGLGFQKRTRKTQKYIQCDLIK